ncbi:MAG: hypothetical protein MR433_02055 [Coriobacteriaceae bacterium]|nr:hypothetical protein [Coriobacteriaceae bacterium]
MRDNNDMAHTAQFDRAQEAEAAESCARPVAGVRTPEETAAALRARLAANHANTLAYVACLKACTGNQRPYREVEEELLSSPAFDISMQTPHTLLGFLIADGGIEKIEVEPEAEAQVQAQEERNLEAASPDAAPSPSDACAEEDVMPAVAGETGGPDKPVDYLLRTTKQGEAILAEFDSVARFERLLSDEPEGYLEAYLIVLDACADEGASLKAVEAALAGHPALTNPKRVYAGYFISKLEHVGAIAWTDAWRITEDGKRIIAALSA